MRAPLFVCLLAANFLSSTTVPGQQIAPARAETSRSIKLNVVVAPKSGPQVTGLETQDFTLLDNKTQRPLTSFKVVAKGQEPVKVILMIDAVNTTYSRVAYVRDQVQRFLRADSGHLLQPTTIAVLTDKGAEMQPGFSTDGNALGDALQHFTIPLREITRATGIWGANDRVQISLTAVRQLTAFAASSPGRTILLWISPGWPLLSGARVDLDARQQNQIFADVVSFSTLMRQAGLTLYNVNPLGPEESLIRASYYESFTKGVSKPGQTDVADLSLQVLALQTGGLVLNGNSDVAEGLKRCLRDTEAWYEITFDGAAAEKANEYHHVEIKVDKPGLTARTRDGYYAQP